MKIRCPVSYPSIAHLKSGLPIFGLKNLQIFNRMKGGMFLDLERPMHLILSDVKQGLTVCGPLNLLSAPCDEFPHWLTAGNIHNTNSVHLITCEIFSHCKQLMVWANLSREKKC
jgi:hypothetical protein